MAVSKPRKPGELPDVRQIARRIRACCMERGWDEVELARRADISRTTLYNLRQENSRRPRITTLTSLAEAFEMSLDRFLWGDSSFGSLSSPAFSEGSGRFNRETNREIRSIQEEHPHLFRDWSDREWDELYSTFGVGGALSPEGVIENAKSINQSRETRRQLNLVLETHLKEVAVQMVESLYRMVVPEGNLAPGQELDALMAAHFDELTGEHIPDSVEDDVQ
ncbi:MAG: XRE family transcriptional regulator [Planctomycetaceae bacterium]|nr:XRE family transcriptional regulator [Planctomycetaceae bacterium]